MWFYDSWAIMCMIPCGFVPAFHRADPEQSLSRCLISLSLSPPSPSLSGFWNKPSLHQNGLNKHRAPQSCTKREPVQVGQRD